VRKVSELMTQRTNTDGGNLNAALMAWMLGKARIAAQTMVFGALAAIVVRPALAEEYVPWAESEVRRAYPELECSVSSFLVCSATPLSCSAPYFLEPGGIAFTVNLKENTLRFQFGKPLKTSILETTIREGGSDGMVKVAFEKDSLNLRFDKAYDPSAKIWFTAARNGDPRYSQMQIGTCSSE
jgi:hypothetical protein